MQSIFYSFQSRGRRVQNRERGDDDPFVAAILVTLKCLV